MSHPISLASLVFGPLEFEQPLWLLLIPILGALTILLARKSLSGLMSGSKVVAIIVRLIVIILLAGAMAEPLWRKESKDLAVIAIVDVSESIPRSEQRKVQGYFEEAIRSHKQRDEKLGVITTARDAFVGALPSSLLTSVEYAHQGTLDATNLAAGIRLANALPRNAATRYVLITDGNQTSGDLMQAAQTAAAQGIPIDVVPIRFEYAGEVMADRLVAPATAREGETMNVRVVLVASAPARGKLNLLLNGQPVDLDPDGPGLGRDIELSAGQRVFQVPVTALKSGPQEFKTVFEPETRNGVPVSDNLAQNNVSTAVTFVAGKGKVLVLHKDGPDGEKEARELLAAMAEARIESEARPASQAPATLTEFSTFDAIVLVNQSAYEYSQKQQEDLRQYVSDAGGGLVMIGGDQSFGAGGWIGSPLEEALPIRLDPPQKRQMPRGALVLCIHSVEMPEGTFYGKKVCTAAINRLSRLDLVGINEYRWTGGHEWVYPLSTVGDGVAVKRAIENLAFGDMQDFTPSFQMSLTALKKADAGQRHMIVISDGDPQIPPDSLLREYRENGITVSTVGVFPHSGLDTSRMQEISRKTGGRHYEVNTQAALAKLPEIFVKEAMTVKRSLIYEKPGPGIAPSLFPGASDALRGIRGVPNINGYVVTAEREGLALVTAKVQGADPETADPLLAQWQYGLGRVVTFTSDATTRWGGQWAAWDGYRQFWEQHVRWVLRPQGSANVRVSTENKGDSTLITVDALDTTGERLSFANFRGRLAAPDGRGSDVELTQVGPGRYQAMVPTDQSGAYLLNLRYAAPDENASSGVLEGTVQASIARPFADEYRVLKDNTAILQQVADATKGRVLTGDPATDDLWSREKSDGTILEPPVTKTPIWLTLTVLGIGLFVVDVGVRRVRIDPAMIAGFVKRVTGKSTAAGSAQIGSLKAAREQAKQRIAERAATTGQTLSADDLAKQAKEEAQRLTQTSKAKFEASSEQLREVREAGGGVAMGGADAKPRPTQPKAPPTDAKAGEEQGMNRLMQAKKKAREEMEDQS